MSRINKTICDFCGEDVTNRASDWFPKRYKVKIIRSYMGYNEENKKLDICEECMKDIIDYCRDMRRIEKKK